MNRIFVTGGFGFLGSHLIEELVKDSDNRVHVVDNLSTSPINVERYLDELGHPSNLTYSICSVNEYCRSVNNETFDQIYHLASVVGPAGVLPHAGKMIKSIVDDTYSLIELAAKCNAKLVDVSTSEVYGGGQDGYCTEDYPKIVPAKTTIRMEYAIGKLAGETAIINTHKVSNLKACIIRPFNIAGPRQSGKGGFVLPRFVTQSFNNEPLTVFGNGKQIRAFTHVKDTVDGLIKTMKHGRQGEAYNIGNPENKTIILELAYRVIKLTKSKSGIAFVDPKTIYGPLYEEANDKYPEASKAMKELGWKYRYDIDKVILDVIEECLKQT